MGDGPRFRWERLKEPTGPSARSASPALVLLRTGRAKSAERAGAGTAPTLGAILLLLCAVAFSVLGGPTGPDPHLVKAKDIVEHYERGRAKDVRDYSHAAYRSALVELGDVDARSADAPEAAALAGQIRARIEAQRAAARTRSEEVAARQELEQKRDERFFEGQRRGQPQPDAGAAACKEEEGPRDPEHPE